MTNYLDYCLFAVLFMQKAELAVCSKATASIMTVLGVVWITRAEYRRSKNQALELAAVTSLLVVQRFADFVRFLRNLEETLGRETVSGHNTCLR